MITNEISIRVKELLITLYIVGFPKRYRTITDSEIKIKK